MDVMTSGNAPDQAPLKAKSLAAAVRLDEWSARARVSGGIHPDEPRSLFVVSVDFSSDPQMTGRLGDLGFQPGEPILILGFAPLGEPVFVEVRETVLALRVEEARHIFVSDEWAPLKDSP